MSAPLFALPAPLGISAPSAELLQLWGLAVCWLAALAVFLTFYTVATRIRKQAFVAPEDFGPEKFDFGADPDVARCVAMHRNLLESAALFLLVALVYIHTGPTARQAQIFFTIYCVGRVVHAILYATKSTVRAPVGFAPPTFTLVAMTVCTAGSLLGVDVPAAVFGPEL